jgi:hypothetical protein
MGKGKRMLLKQNGTRQGTAGIPGKEIGLFPHYSQLKES